MTFDQYTSLGIISNESNIDKIPKALLKNKQVMFLKYDKKNKGSIN